MRTALRCLDREAKHNNYVRCRFPLLDCTTRDENEFIKRMEEEDEEGQITI